MKTEVGWLTLPLDPKVKTSYYIQAAALNGSIFVFGGGFSSPKCMMEFDSEGKLVYDSSDLPLVPTGCYMTAGVSQGKKLFAMTYEGNSLPRGVVWEGEKWAYF